MSCRSSRGFTMVEIFIVLSIVGILVRLMMPAYDHLVRDARAAQIAGDVDVVRSAAFAYHAATNGWPAESAIGTAPPELVSYLPRGFSFVKSRYQLDWENWVLPDGTPQNPSSQVMLGISVHTQDAVLGNAVVAVLGRNTTHYTMNGTYTFLISSTFDGAP